MFKPGDRVRVKAHVEPYRTGTGPFAYRLSGLTGVVDGRLAGPRPNNVIFDKDTLPTVFWPSELLFADDALELLEKADSTEGGEKA
jgi:hypothetical protein